MKAKGGERPKRDPCGMAEKMWGLGVKERTTKYSGFRKNSGAMAIFFGGGDPSHFTPNKEGCGCLGVRWPIGDEKAPKQTFAAERTAWGKWFPPGTGRVPPPSQEQGVGKNLH